MFPTLFSGFWLATVEHNCVMTPGVIIVEDDSFTRMTSVISELTGGVFSLQSQPGGGAVLTAQLVRFTADPRKVNESRLG